MGELTKVVLISFFILLLNPVLFSEHKNCISSGLMIDLKVDSSEDQIKDGRPGINLSIHCATKRVLTVGATFIHKVYLTNGSLPISNAAIKILDPISQTNTIVKTNSQGAISWSSYISEATKPQLYTFEFSYEGMICYSNVAVSSSDSKNVISLPSYKINLGSLCTLDDQTLLLANNGVFSTNVRYSKKTLEEAVKFGLAVVKDYLKDPKNLFNIAVAVTSCYSQIITLCVEYTGRAIAGIAISALRMKLIEIIENKYKDDILTQNKLKTILKLSSTAFSVIGLGSSVSILNDIDAFFATVEFKESAIDIVRDVNDEIRGASIAAQKKGRNEVVVFSIYDTKKEILPDPVTSVNPDCAENFTGKFFFQNNTNLGLRVTLNSSPSKKWASTMPFTCTLQPGQKQGFYEVPEGVAFYKISTEAVVQGSNIGGSNSSSIQNRELNSEGQLFVEKCKENVFTINLDSSSIVSNSPSQTDSKSKNPNCIVTNTGDYCFQNNTGNELRIQLSIPSGRRYQHSAPLWCTIQPGQKQCFYDLPGGAIRYDIQTISKIYGNISGPRPKEYFAEGELYVDACKTNFFLIKQ